MAARKVSGLLLDIDSKQDEAGLAYIRLFLRTERGIEGFTDPDFRPYFYAVCDDARKRAPQLESWAFNDNGREVRPLKAEPVEKANAPQAVRLFFRNTSDLTAARGEVKKVEGVKETREYDIPFAKRYLIDKGLEPMGLVQAEADEQGLLKKVETGKDGKEAEEKLRVCAFDLETLSPGRFSDPKRDAIVLASYVDEGEQHVFTWKKVNRKYATVFKDEREMVQALVDKIKERDPDVVVTYNGDMFDFPYLKERCRRLGVKFDVNADGSEPIVKRKGLDNAVKVRGRQHIDAFQIVRLLARIGVLSLVKFDLESVAKVLYNEEKEKVKPEEINQAWDTGKGLERVADYNLADATYTLRIAKDYLPLTIAMARLTRQTAFDVSRSSTGVLVEYLLIDKSFRHDLLIPNKPREEEVEARQAQSFKGGYVKSPVPGLHENIAVLDFRSLHPSIIISHHISPDTLNCSCCKGTSPHKAPTGDWFCDKRQGFFSSLLEDILKRRIAVQGEMKRQPKGSTAYNVLYARQWALKILLNSFYGVLGYSRFRWYSRECATAVTAWSRHYIREVLEAAEKEGFAPLYGDSLTGERNVVLKDAKGHVVVRALEDLFEAIQALPRARGPKEAKPMKGWQALSVNPLTLKPEWKSVREIIRHQAGKRVFRVGQKFGETRVTEDHSLVVKNGNTLAETKPLKLAGRPLFAINEIPAGNASNDIDIFEALKDYNYEVLYKDRVKIVQPKTDGQWVWFGWNEQKTPVKVKRFLPIESPEFEAVCRLFGAYLAEGSSSTVETTASRLGASIACGDTAWLEQLRQDYGLLFANAQASIIRSTVGPHELSYTVGGVTKQVTYDDQTHKLQMMNALSAVVFRQFCGQKSAGKRMPDFIFNVPDKYKRLLLENYLKGDGSHSVNKRLGYTKEYVEKNFAATTKSLTLASGLSLLLKQLKINYSIQYRKTKGVYTLKTCTKHNKHIQTKVEEEPYGGYVYDLAVADNHNFVDACGLVCVHNTDSAFLVVPKGRGEAEVRKFAEAVNKKLPGVMELEFEGFYKRGLFVTKKEGGAAKKRYALIDAEGNMTIVGFEYVRRDWAVIAKETQKAVLEAILKEGSPEKAVKVVREAIERLKKGKVPNKELIMYTQLRQTPSRYELTAPHVAAALKALKKGKEIGVGSVLEFIITKSGKSISDKAELAEFVKEGDYDADYYIHNQVVPAVIKIMRELGCSEQDLVQGGKQSSLGAFS